MKKWFKCKTAFSTHQRGDWVSPDGLQRSHLIEYGYISRDYVLAVDRPVRGASVDQSPAPVEVQPDLPDTVHDLTPEPVQFDAPARHAGKGKKRRNG